MLLEGLEETNGPLMVELQKPHGASLGISLSGMETYIIHYTCIICNYNYVILGISLRGMEFCVL